MRSTSSNFIAEKNKDKNRPIFLYTIVDYDGNGNNLYYAEWDEDVTFGGITYQKFPITHEYISENAEGQIDTLKVKVANVNRLIGAYLEEYDAFRGKEVRIKLVFYDRLDDPDAYLEDVYYVDEVVVNEEVVEFTLSSKFDLLQETLPRRRFYRNFCQWKFKSTECGYTGTETSCNKTLQRCKELGNEARFGGFPSIPKRGVYIV